MSRQNNPITHRDCCGFSLVELMVAIVLSSLLLFGVTEIYLSNKQSNRLQNGFSTVQENGRMAVELLTRDIRVADFWGCIPDSGSIDNNLDQASANYDPSLHSMVNGGLGGLNNITSHTINGKSVLAGTDVLILRGAKENDVRIEKPYMTIKSAAVHINKGSKIQPDDVLLISDCMAGDVFQNTASNTPTSGTISHNTGTGTIGNGDKEFKKIYGGDARVLRPYVKAYFIALGTNGLPSLYVSEDGNLAELIPGVEDMQVTYGEDTDGDLVPDVWRAAGVVADMQAVLAVKVELMVASDEVVGSTAANSPDRRLRKPYFFTTNIRNRMI